MIRRGLPVLSLVLVLLGLELSTGALSESAAEMGRVLGAVLSGEPTAAYLPGFFSGLLAIGLGGAGLAVSLWTRIVRGGLARGRTCPRCGERTHRIKRRSWQRLLARLLAENVQRRLCRDCGWKGLSRVRD